MQLARMVPPLLAVLQVVATTGAVASTGSPVEKVVSLLEGLKTKLNQDEKEEQFVYDKYACWCQKTTARKAKSIEDAEDDLHKLGQDILIQKGKVTTLAGEIKQAKTDIKENEEAQADATSIRTKAKDGNQAETAELNQVISELQRALIVLRGVKAKDRPTITGILDEINILDKRYSTVADDLQGKESDEADQNRDFKDLIAIKQEELLQLQDGRMKAERNMAEAERMLAEATQSYDDTEAQSKADIEFVATTKEGCEGKATAWQERKRLRTEELAGISKALEILSSDEARELFNKAIKPGHATLFLQVSSSWETSAPARVRKAYEILKKKAAGSHNLRLAHVAASVRLADVGHFDEVLKAIDDMIVNLQAEDKADIDKRDQCLEEYNKINSTVADLAWKIEVNDATIGKSISLLENLGLEKQATLDAIDDVAAHISDITTERTEENASLMAAKKDDENAIVLLNQTTDALKEFYAKNDVELPVYMGSVVAILANIVEDLEGEIKAAMRDDQAAQTNFEEAERVADKLHETLTKKKDDIVDAIADREADNIKVEEEKTANEADEKGEEEYQAAIKPDCDFIIVNHAERAEKRRGEATGLRQAKEFLAGYQEPSRKALVQAHKPSLTKSVLRGAVVAKHVPRA